jgi:hypothetical protein
MALGLENQEKSVGCCTSLVKNCIIVFMVGKTIDLGVTGAYLLARPNP